MITQEELADILKIKDGHLFRREGQELEFKEQFNLAGLADYFRDFAAFSNNRGGLLIFGIKDSPRLPTGLSSQSREHFKKIDPEKITGYLLEIFSGDIRWEQADFSLDGKAFGIFHVKEAQFKPIIAKKNEGKEQVIKSGEIYYRYAGRTQVIQYAELQNIIQKRIEQNNSQWLDLVQKIGRAGPQNAAILDTERGLISKEQSQILVLDEELASKLTFIKKGEFVEQNGAKTLQLVGNIVSVDKIEVVKKIKENLLKDYPLSALQLVSEVKKLHPAASQSDVWNVLKENKVKDNPVYSTYNFRNKKQEDDYTATKILPSATPSIYKVETANFVVNVLKNAKK